MYIAVTMTTKTILFVSTTVIACFASSFLKSLLDYRKEAELEINRHDFQRFPPHWDTIESKLKYFHADLNQGDTQEHSAYVHVDAWNYLHRMRLYKILLDLTEPYMSHFASGENVLWGSALQHGWQFSSGRLWIGGKEGIHGDMKMSPCSWWSFMNYFISVIPFIGAGQAGLYDENFYFDKPNSSYCHDEVLINITMKRIIGHVQYYSLCSDQNCMQLEDEAIARWTDFFFSFTKFENELMTVDKMAALMWRAHMSSIDAGLLASEPLVKLMSHSEANFGLTWALFVEFFEGCRFRTNFQETNFFQGLVIPKRTLREGDIPPYISDMTWLENRALTYFWHFSTLNEWIGTSGLKKLWLRAMCGNRGRELGREVMKSFLIDPLNGLVTLSKIVVKMIWLSCDE